MSDPNQEFQPPPPPPATPASAPPEETMSTPQTLTGIFFEPGRVFTALRDRPRFLVAAVVIMIAFFAYYISYIQKVGYETLITAETNSGTRAQSMSAEDKDRAISVQMNPVVKALRYGGPLLTFAIFFSLGSALYLLGVKMMGKEITYKQSLSVWTYSSLPPTLLLMLLNIVVLFVKMPEDDISIVKGQGGLVHANPGMFMDGAAHPALASFAGAFDVFAFYGLFLAALGLRKVCKLSSGASWGIVLGLWIIGVIVRVAFSAIAGRPIG
ncbi:MAG TPA: YIP1 family protein [Pyrinomonadaceae bacterium]|nr:YIP1 family protein [Pyrinomonadaceae bacterium]